MAKWGATKVTQHERVSVPPEHYIEDAVEAVRYGDYKLAEKLYAKAYKTALGTQDEKVISDTVKQGLKNLKEHWNHTSPEDFINKAGKAAEEEKYECAERVYLNALRAAQGKPIAGIIAAEVKKRLTAMYLFWSTSYTKNYDFADAEPIILKKLKIADDKAVVKEELLR
ncbi:MAG: hypothetical protein K5686_13265, partial [Lachnospiraceae bacterium]|nr:hypothetical protein [Lachnospiraceae bacterium]